MLDEVTVRRHGCKCPWNWRQSAIILVFLFEILIFFLFIFELSNCALMIPIIILFSVLCILILYFGASLMIADPTDSVIRVKYDTQYRFRRDTVLKMEVVQIAKYCQICRSDVQTGTKHCKRCNRCCQRFHHHCKYLNNCVGWNNYKHFTRLIKTSLVMVSLKLLVNTFELILCMNNKFILKIGIGMTTETIVGLLALQFIVDFALFGYLATIPNNFGYLMEIKTSTVPPLPHNFMRRTESEVGIMPPPPAESERRFTGGQTLPMV